MTTSQDKFHEKISGVISDTFEKMAFEEVLLQEIRETEFSLEQTINIFWATIEIISPSLGKMALGIPETLLNQLAEAVIGMPCEELSREQIFDAHGEFINTIAGRIMANLLPPETTFQLGLPRLGEANLPDERVLMREFIFLIQDQNFKLFIPQKAYDSFTKE